MEPEGRETRRADACVHAGLYVCGKKKVPIHSMYEGRNTAFLRLVT